MDREQIIKGLECCLESEYCATCPATGFCGDMDTLMENAFYLIKQLTEENERLRADNLYGLSALKLAKKVEELSRENERLRNRVVCKVVIPDEKLEEIKSECLERVELDIKAIEADTVQKMQDAFAVHFGTYTDKDTVKVLDVFKLLDQIAKEMLEG